MIVIVWPSWWAIICLCCKLRVCMESSEHSWMEWLHLQGGILFQRALQQQSQAAAGSAHEGLYCLQLLQWTYITVVCLYTEAQCSKPPEFKPSGNLSRLWGNVGTTVKLNCTALLLWDQNEEQCDTTLQWSKDGQLLTNLTLYTQNSSSWWFSSF